MFKINCTIIKVFMLCKLIDIRNSWLENSLDQYWIKVESEYWFAKINTNHKKIGVISKGVNYITSIQFKLKR